MTKATKIRAKAAAGVVDFRMLMRHEMESGFRKDENTGENIPAWFIKEFRVQVNNETVLVGFLGPTVSKNPYFKYTFAGKGGDRVQVSWIDNKGIKRVDQDFVRD